MHPTLTNIGLSSGEELFSVLDHTPSPLAFVSANSELKVLYVNKAFTRAFGYQLDEIKTVSGWTELIYPDGNSRQQRLSSWQLEVKQATQTNLPIPDRESHVRCKNNSYLDVIVQTSVLHNLILLTFTDITEIKSLRNQLQESEKQFRSFVEQANDIIFTLNLEGDITYLSPNYKKYIGTDPAELVGKPFDQLIHAEDLSTCIAAYHSALQGHQVTGIEYRVKHDNGSWQWQASSVGPIFDDAGIITGVIGVGRDIQLKKQIEEKLHISEERYRLLSDNARDVIWTIAPDGTITYVSPAVEKTRGFTPQEAMQQPLEKILTPDSIALNLEYFSELHADIAAKRPPKSFRGDMEYLCKDGSTYWCDVIATPILSNDGSLVELLGVSRDISEHKRYENELKKAKESTEVLNRTLEAANERLNRMATTDTLTKLWNRRYFEEKVAYEMSMADRYVQSLSLLIFDIDHFKVVNDTYGHLAGDHVLVELSKLTRQHIRATDVPCRWGGEEFMILMPNTDSKEAITVAEKLRLAFSQHQMPEAGTITASFGVATYQPTETLDTWVKRIDNALYAAKNAGRNTVRLAMTTHIQQ